MYEAKAALIMASKQFKRTENDLRRCQFATYTHKRWYVCLQKKRHRMIFIYIRQQKQSQIQCEGKNGKPKFLYKYV